jgi:hypothetical protein
VLAGIVVGEEIYCTGGVHTPIRKSGYNIFMGDKFSGASSGVWTPPSNQTGHEIQERFFVIRLFNVDIQTFFRFVQKGLRKVGTEQF